MYSQCSGPEASGREGLESLHLPGKNHVFCLSQNNPQKAEFLWGLKAIASDED